MAKKLLTISLLVSNRIDTIDKCLSSLKPIMDALDADLIVVDTVGEENSDGSLAVARKYTDKIIHFDWIKDFAAARNVGIDAADSEWFMFIDDDEWFESTDEIINFFKSGEYQNYNAANYYIRNYSDYEGHYSKAQVSRLFKMNEGIRFHGAIHEKLNLSFADAKCLKDYVHHYGYAYKTEEEHIAKIMRNRPVLEEMIKENPDQIDLASQYLIELAASGSVIEVLNKAKEYADKFIDLINYPAYSLIICYYFSYLHDCSDSLEECEEEYKKYYLVGELSPIVPPIIDFFMGKIYMKYKKYRKAIYQFERYRAGITLVRERVHNYEAILIGFCMSFYEKDVWNESLYFQAICFLVLCPMKGLAIDGYELDEDGLKFVKSMSEKDKLNNQEKAIYLLKGVYWNDEMEDLTKYMTIFLYACQNRKRMSDFDEALKPYLKDDKAVFTAWRAFFETGYKVPEYLIMVDADKYKKFVGKYPQYLEHAKQLLTEKKRIVEFNSLKEQLAKEVETLRNAGKLDEAKQLIKEAKKLGVELN